MGDIELIKFNDAEQLAQGAARAWLEEMDHSQPCSVALSGGRIGGRFYLAVADLVRKRGAALGGVHFFWGDERCVSPNDPESNYKLAHERLLVPLRIQDGQIHRIRAEKPAGVAAAQAQAELVDLAPKNTDGQPVLDLILLGMGEEGHVASLFPGESEAIMDSPEVFRPVTALKPPPRRITMGYSTIVAARQVWVLASGAGKEKALRDSLASGDLTPLGKVLRMRSGTKIFTDLSSSET